VKVLVCGGRKFSDRDLLYKVLNVIHNGVKGGITTIIHGGATGADSIAGDWSVNVLKKEAEVYLANWNLHKTAAGPIRNRKMLKEGKPDIVVAFPGGSGTADMIKIATAAGVKVFDIENKLVYNERNSVTKFL
jgi:predicted Rossmann-fold nucleotide-binding protein